MKIRNLVLAGILCASAALAQSDGYQDARYLGYKPVVNGVVCDPIIDACTDRHVQAYILEAAGFQYLISKPSDANAPVVMPSPFFRHDSNFLNTTKPGTILQVRVAGQKLYIQEGKKERSYPILSVVPAAK